MSKTITLRLEDNVYELLKRASEGEHRTISDYIENAALNYDWNDIFVSDDEMEELKYLFPTLRKGLKQAIEWNYTLINNFS
ncbi:MAG: CopG family transcriptional regulator [Bacteroidetes bacterium]|nr:MAG: CopG family transcriptional regulator [Bacteroidota bacterium]